MEDRLEEAIHVLRSHAVGQGPGLEGAHSDMHSLLSSVHNGGLGGLSPAFPNASLALSNRHPAMVNPLLCSGSCPYVCVCKTLVQTQVFTCQPLWTGTLSYCHSENVLEEAHCQPHNTLSLICLIGNTLNLVYGSVAPGFD